MSGLSVLNAGPLTLLQDAGRFAFQHLGVSPSGPMDVHAAAWANHLLGNAWGTPLLEITLGGLVLQAQLDTGIALCGPELPLWLDDEPMPLWQSFVLRKGQTLKLGYARSGLRLYLAVLGGFTAKAQLGSVATQRREGLGGLQGGGVAVEQGDVLPCAAASLVSKTSVPQGYIPSYKPTEPIRVVFAEGETGFDLYSQQKFCDQAWLISPQSDRMGIRLQGLALSAARPTWSTPVVTGSIQVPPDGQPIVLAADRQTLGGYPVLGWLSPLDLGRLAQLPARSSVCFQKVHLEEVQQELRAFYRFFGRP